MMRITLLFVSLLLGTSGAAFGQESPAANPTPNEPHADAARRTPPGGVSLQPVATAQARREGDSARVLVAPTMPVSDAPRALDLVKVERALLGTVATNGVDFPTALLLDAAMAGFAQRRTETGLAPRVLVTPNVAVGAETRTGDSMTVSQETSSVRRTSEGAVKTEVAPAKPSAPNEGGGAPAAEPSVSVSPNRSADAAARGDDRDANPGRSSFKNFMQRGSLTSEGTVPQGDLSHVAVPAGFELKAVAMGLDFPTAITMDGATLYVAEAGAFPGTFPAVLRIDTSVEPPAMSVLLIGTDLPQGTFLGPLTDVNFHAGRLWVTHRQNGANGWAVGAISRFSPNDPVGTFETVLTNLPSAGDHYTEQLVFDGAGRAYFSQGSATNSGIVGADNMLITQWLGDFPTFHDFPPKPVAVSGVSLASAVGFSLDPGGSLTTAPYRPFGSGPVAPGTVIPGATPQTPQEGMIAGNGTVYSFNPDAPNPAATLQLESWGLRNPYGIGFDPFAPNQLFITNNGADIRRAPTNGTTAVVETRPIANDWDDLFVITVGGDDEFFGWPDFAHEPTTGSIHRATSPFLCDAPEPLQIPCPTFLNQTSLYDVEPVQHAFAQFQLHSSANKFDFAQVSAFGFTGDLFVAETGSFVGTGAQGFAGHKVVRVDRGTREVHDFVVNTGTTPAEVFAPAGFNKPIDVEFDGERMFIVDFGVFEPSLQIQESLTGKIWVLAPIR